MSNKTFVFAHSPSLAAFEARLETPKGMAALAQVQDQFATLADLLHNTTQHAGHVTIHVPDGDTITFTPMTKTHFTNLAIEVGNLIGATL